MSDIQIIQCNSLAWLEENTANNLLRFDCIITDPPYDSLIKWQGIGTSARMGFGAGKDATKSDKFYPTIDREQMWEILCQLDKIAAMNSHTYIMCDGDYMPRILGWVRESGELSWQYSKPLVWDKVNAGMGYHWRGTHEYIVMLEKGKRRLNDLGKQDVLRHRRVTGGYPTEKPLALIEELLLNSTKECDWVFDPFCGSGVTAAACQKHNRNCVTLDISDRAITHAKQRLDQPKDALLAL
jgi:site-specific DNA-methyltransferase (adenine-specific)